jgi:outer membrane protein assembly factor BamD (BamD/ComL family)
MRFSDYISIRLILCLIAVSVAFHAPDKARATDVTDSEATRQFSFAENLFAEGDYYRAISEYKRFLFYYPQNKLVENCTYRIGESYYKGKRWHEALKSFSSFIMNFPESPLVPGALYHKGMSEKQLKRYTDALSTLEELSKSKSIEFADKAVYQKAIVLMEMEEWQKARKAFLIVPKDSPLSISAGVIASELLRMDDLPQKSPAAAGTLAAILPGAGHLYTERPRDALVAFLLNGAFIWGAVELFRHDNYVAAAIVTFFEIGWYTGNIYSAVSSAHKYNKRTRQDFIEHLKEISSVSFQHDRNTSSNNIMFSFKF